MIDSPRLPDAPEEWSKPYQNRLNNVLMTFFKRLTSEGPFRCTKLKVVDIVVGAGLTSGVTAGDVTFVVDDITQFTETGYGTINDEKFSWAGTSGSSLTGVSRGLLGTTATSHASGDIVVPTADTGAIYAHPTTHALYRVF
jgi:hypothetical protein